jgi:hypothetical protein
MLGDPNRFNLFGGDNTLQSTQGWLEAGRSIVPIDTRGGLQEVFFETSQKHARDRGYDIGDDVDLRQIALRGAEEILNRANRNNIDVYHPRIMQDITEAEYHAKLFIDEMIQSNRTRNPGSRSGTLGANDYQVASNLRSPIWPFCRSI